MRAPAVLLLALLAAGPAFAQTPDPAPAPGDELAQAAALVQRLQGQLQTAFVELERLRGSEATAVTAKAALDVCHARNLELVDIGRDILAAYDKRYQRRIPDPLQLDRTRFETAVQGFADRLYDARHDAVAPAPPPAEPAPASSQQSQEGTESPADSRTSETNPQ